MDSFIDRLKQSGKSVKFAVAAANIGLVLVATGILRSGDRRLTSLTPGIRFEDVSLAYDTATDHALKDVRLIIPSGKTTLSLVPRGQGSLPSRA
jgi:ABC-type multidrug transport system fused ATPase/permease subunit